MSALPIPPIPPFKKDAIIPGAADKPEKDLPASPPESQVKADTQIQKYTKKNQLTNNQKNVLDKIQNFFVTPISYFTGVIGLFSFALPNFFDSENDFVDKIANYSSKAAVYATSAFSLLNRVWTKDMIGTLAFSTDFITATIANEDDLYQWKGFGSGLDHGPLILGEVATNPEIGYKLTPGDEKADFQDYRGFWDSTKKIGSGVKVIINDTFNEFKNNNPTEAFKNCFLSGKRNAEKNLFVSGVGIIAGAFLGTILGFKKTGATIRDTFGAYADLAYIAKGLSKTSNQTTLNKESQSKYFEGGIEYTVGSGLDLIYRWTGIRGLNYLALGADRIGARNATLGMVLETDGK